MALAGSFSGKYQAAGIARQALKESQLIAVLEVRNLTGDTAAAGRILRDAITASLIHAPLDASLHEAAASQSRIQLAGEAPQRMRQGPQESKHIRRWPQDQTRAHPEQHPQTDTCLHSRLLVRPARH